uniref:Putative secreted protein n=1 Tax=Rhipicephalus microplus TaxID=6941 RepID=A0A6G5A1M7_RHIMP
MASNSHIFIILRLAVVLLVLNAWTCKGSFDEEAIKKAANLGRRSAASADLQHVVKTNAAYEKGIYPVPKTVALDVGVRAICTAENETTSASQNTNVYRETFRSTRYPCKI